MKNIFQKTILAITLTSVFPVQAESLPEVVVTATRQATRTNEIMSDVTVITRENIENIGQGTIVDLLSRQAGIQTIQLGGAGNTTDFQLRGTRSEQTKILLDGVPINSMDTKGSPLRTLALDDVERIEILRGPASALYGSDAIGGVIQIFTRQARSGIHGEVAAGFGSQATEKYSGNLSFANEQWSARIASSDYRTDGISSLLNGRNKDTDKDGYSDRSNNVSLGFRPAPGHELAFSAMDTRGTLHSDSASTNANSNSYDNHTDFHNEVLNLSSSDQISEGWHSLLRYGINVQDDVSYSRSTSNVIQASPLRTENHTLGWQNDVDLPLGKGLILFERQDQHAGPGDRFPVNRNVSLDAWQLGWTASLGNHRWQLGGRHDSHSQFGDKNTGSATYGYRFAPGWNGHVSTATSFRAPTLYQLYAMLPNNALNPNPALRPESGRNYEASLSHDWENNILSLTFFRNRVQDLIDFSSTGNQYRNISSAKFEGWTLAWQGQLAQWNMGANLDILDATDLSTGMPLKRRAREKVSFTADHSWGAWNGGLEIVAVGRRYDTDTQTLREGGYTLLNLTGRYAINNALSIEARADNIADKSYINAYSSGGTFTYRTPGASYFVGLRYKM